MLRKGGGIMAAPIPTEISILEVGMVQYSPNGHPFLECMAKGGTVAFWGSRENMKNIQRIQQTQTPFEIVCDSINSNWPTHDLWIPERGEIYSIDPIETPTSSASRSLDTAPNIVSLQELAQWRHAVIDIVKELEGAQPEGDAADGVALRISRLSYRNAIPREICALMRTVTEMRNAAEYNSKVLSAYESMAVRNAWLAVEEWWKQTRMAQR
jgi:hypothetical protein